MKSYLLYRVLLIIRQYHNVVAIRSDATHHEVCCEHRLCQQNYQVKPFVRCIKDCTTVQILGQILVCFCNRRISILICPRDQTGGNISGELFSPIACCIIQNTCKSSGNRVKLHMKTHLEIRCVNKQRITNVAVTCLLEIFQRPTPIVDKHLDYLRTGTNGVGWSQKYVSVHLDYLRTATNVVGWSLKYVSVHVDYLRTGTNGVGWLLNYVSVHLEYLRTGTNGIGW